LRVAGNRKDAGDVLLYRCTKKNGQLTKAKTCLLPTRNSLANKESDNFKFKPVIFYPQAQPAPSNWKTFNSDRNVDVDGDQEPSPARLGFQAPANSHQAHLIQRRQASGLSVTPHPDVTPAFIKDARALCNVIIGEHACKDMVTPTNFVEACVNDAALTGTLDLIEGHKANYAKVCVNTVNSITTTAGKVDVKTPARRAVASAAVIETAPGKDDEDLASIKAAALKVAQVVGIHENKCPANCSNNGQCFDSGCRCTSGWTGDSCQINVRDILAAHKKTTPKRRAVSVISM
jgi:hypothetical protein